MRIFFTLIFFFAALPLFSQDLTGIWRGNFISGDVKMSNPFAEEQRYKYEVQIDQRGKNFEGVTYSYKTTVFYGKAAANGTINPVTGKVMLQELKLLEVKMASTSYACWMICFLQYSKNGDEEFLEGKFSSYRESDSSACGRGTVFLRRVVTSDFYREPFLAKRAKEKSDSLARARQKAIATAKPPANKPPVAATTAPVKKPATPPANAATKNNKPSTNPVAKTTAPKQTAGAKSNAPATVEPGIVKPDQLVTRTPDSASRTPVVKMKEPATLPAVLKNRENELVKALNVSANEITINIYDNGTIDHDTISVYLDKKLVVNHQMLTTSPITVKLKLDETTDFHELVMVADNLGDIPPNTSLMVVKAGDKTYEVRIASTEQKNAVVTFRYEKPVK